MSTYRQTRRQFTLQMPETRSPKGESTEAESSQAPQLERILSPAQSFTTAVEERPVVAFLGPEASYTHQATLSTFPSEDYTLQPATTIEDVFLSISTNTATYGVVPFENSSNGSVIFTLDLLKSPYGEQILVNGEIYLPVHHCLIGYPQPENLTSGDFVSKRYDLPWRKQVSKEGTISTTTSAGTKEPYPRHEIKHIKKLYSHPQAWGQCTKFLTSHLKKTERQDVSSTSRAAELVAESEDPKIAAISSKLAAQVNGLEVLAENIEDNEGNSTRFLILTARDKLSLRPPLSSQPSDGDYKTLISFTVSHESPGALADSLAVFKKHNLNLTSINTRPSGNDPWHYVFFVEFKGRKLEEREGGAVNEALEELGGVAESWRWLGSWENQLGK